MESEYLRLFADKLPVAEISARRESRRGELLDIDYWAKYRLLERDLPSFPKCAFTSTDGYISLSTDTKVTDSDRQRLQEAIKTLIPWRKGPMKLFGIEIDAEWRSNLKWDRIYPHLDPIQGKRILDIGCNNGYYLFRATEHAPALALGIDPAARYYLQFQLVQRYLNNPALFFELFGVEDVDLYPDFFDLVLCMGIIYHNRSPLGALQKIHQALAPGGQLILESLAIPGDQPMSLSPPDRYGKMRNVWFIPTAACMASWLKLTGFTDIKIISSVQLTEAEQRKTEFMPWESLNDYLDPEDKTKTMEGYPAPLRVAVSARRRGLLST